MMLSSIGRVIERVDTRHFGHSVPVKPFGFSLSVQCSVPYMRYSTCWFKIGSMLDDFAQLWANESVLSRFEAG